MRARLFSLDGPGLFLALALVGAAFAPSLTAEADWTSHRERTSLAFPALSGPELQLPHPVLPVDTQAEPGSAERTAAASTSDTTGTAVLALRATSLSLHLIVVFLLSILIRRWGTGGPAGLMGLLFFGLHPVTAEAVLSTASMNQLGQALGVLGFLVCCTGKDSEGLAWGQSTAAAGFVGIGAFCEPSTLWLFPALVFLVRSLRPLPWSRLAPAGVSLVFGLGLHGSWAPQTPPPFGFLTEPSNLPLFLLDGLRGLVTFQPLGLRHLYWDYLHLSGLLSLVSVLLLSLLGVVAYRLRWWAPLLPWSVVLYLLSAALGVTVTTLPDSPGFGSFLYLPLTFLVLGLVQLYSSAGGSARWRGGSPTKVAAAVVIGLQMLLLQQTQNDWKSNLDLGKSAIRIQPNQGAGYVWVGDALLLTRDCSPSLPWYRRSVEVEPSYAPGYFKFISCLAQLGQNNEALNAVIALEIRQSSSSTLSPVKASLLIRLGRSKEAHDVIDQGLMERPESKQLLHLKEALVRGLPQPTHGNQPAP